MARGRVFHRAVVTAETDKFRIVCGVACYCTGFLVTNSDRLPKESAIGHCEFLILQRIGYYVATSFRNQTVEDQSQEITRIDGLILK